MLSNCAGINSEDCSDLVSGKGRPEFIDQFAAAQMNLLVKKVNISTVRFREGGFLKRAQKKGAKNVKSEHTVLRKLCAHTEHRIVDALLIDFQITLVSSLIPL